MKKSKLFMLIGIAASSLVATSCNNTQSSTLSSASNTGTQSTTMPSASSSSQDAVKLSYEQYAAEFEALCSSTSLTIKSDSRRIGVVDDKVVTLKENATITLDESAILSEKIYTGYYDYTSYLALVLDTGLLYDVQYTSEDEKVDDASVFVDGVLTDEKKSSIEEIFKTIIVGVDDNDDPIYLDFSTEYFYNLLTFDSKTNTYTKKNYQITSEGQYDFSITFDSDNHIKSNIIEYSTREGSSTQESTVSNKNATTVVLPEKVTTSIQNRKNNIA